jgi:hypothetical protein
LLALSRQHSLTKPDQATAGRALSFPALLFIKEFHHG